MSANEVDEINLGMLKELDANKMAFMVFYE